MIPWMMSKGAPAPPTYFFSDEFNYSGAPDPLKWNQYSGSLSTVDGTQLVMPAYSGGYYGVVTPTAVITPTKWTLITRAHIYNGSSREGRIQFSNSGQGIIRLRGYDSDLYFQTRISSGGGWEITYLGNGGDVSGFHVFKIVYDSVAGSAVLYIDDVLKATHTSQVPTGAFSITMIGMRYGTSHTCYCDYLRVVDDS